MSRVPVWVRRMVCVVLITISAIAIADPRIFG